MTINSSPQEMDEPADVTRIRTEKDVRVRKKLNVDDEIQGHTEANVRWLGIEGPLEVTYAVPSATGVDNPIGGADPSELIDRMDIIRCEKGLSLRSPETACQGNVTMRLDGVGLLRRSRHLVSTSDVYTDIARVLQTGCLCTPDRLECCGIEGPYQAE